MYRADAYFLAKSTAELPFVTAYSILFVSLCYYMINLYNSAYRFIMAATIVTMVAHVATSFGKSWRYLRFKVMAPPRCGTRKLLHFRLFHVNREQRPCRR